MWRLIAVGLLVAALAGGIARVAGAQIESAAVADALARLSARIDALAVRSKAVIDTSLAPYTVVPDFVGSTNSGTDNAPAINRAIVDACAAGTNTGRPPEIRLPAGRIMVASTIGILCNNLKITGAGNTATEINGLAAKVAGCGNGFSIIANRKPTTRVCTVAAGAGACDSPIGTAGRGPGCPCYLTSDCNGGACGGGSILTNFTMRDMSLTIKNDCSVGIDLSEINSAEIDNVNVTVGSPYSTGINTIDVLAWDDGVAGGGYHNIIENSKLTALTGVASTIIVWSRANDTFILNDYISGTGGVGLKLGIAGSAGAPNANRVIGNTFESAPIALEDHGSGNIIAQNRLEGTGANVQLVVTADANDTAISADNFFESVAAPAIANSGTRTTCGGLPCGATAPNACVGTLPGMRYWDTNIIPAGAGVYHGGVSCFCNGQAAPKYCRDDTGACNTNTDCG